MLGYPLNEVYLMSELENANAILEQIYEARKAGRLPIPPLIETHPFLEAEGITPRNFTLLAQGDSWFDYPGDDIINFLRDRFLHQVENIAVKGSTLNDIVYGPVPKNWLGVPQSNQVDRIQELQFVFNKTGPDAVLLSGGGNDIAGKEFFQLINNKLSNLENPNQKVTEGVVFETFYQAYLDIISKIISWFHTAGREPHIFIHGYDYPYPDGRGFSMFNLVGPWFDETFNKKNYPLTELDARYQITKKIMDEFNTMLAKLASDHAGVVHYVDFRGTLPDHGDWANELHPTRDGFSRLADKLNYEIHKALDTTGQGA